MSKFAKTLYVVIDNQDNDPIMIVHDTISTIDHNEPVAIYQLVEVKKKLVTHELAAKK